MSQLDESQKHLDTFLVNNVELEELTARLSSFNMFGVLRAEGRKSDTATSWHGCWIQQNRTDWTTYSYGDS